MFLTLQLLSMRQEFLLRRQQTFFISSEDFNSFLRSVLLWFQIRSQLQLSLRMFPLKIFWSGFDLSKCYGGRVQERVSQISFLDLFLLLRFPIISKSNPFLLNLPMQFRLVNFSYFELDLIFVSLGLKLTPLISKSFLELKNEHHDLRYSWETTIWAFNFTFIMPRYSLPG